MEYARRADGDFKITESMVVVDYLDAKYGKGNGLTPSDPQQAAEVCILSLKTSKQLRFSAHTSFGMSDLYEGLLLRPCCSRGLPGSHPSDVSSTTSEGPARADLLSSDK